MMKSFKEFLDVLNKESDVTLEPYTGDYQPGLKYTFQVDGDEYTIFFVKTSLGAENYINNLAPNAYSITLEGPNEYRLTGKFRGPTIYRELFKATKKLLDTEKPDALRFFGATPEQSIIYNVIYKKFLSQLYTKISYNQYLRNDLIPQATQGQTYLAKQISDEQKKLDAETQKMKNTKRKNFAVAKTFLGKIAIDSTIEQPVYVSKFTNGELEGLKLKNFPAASTQLVPVKLNIDWLVPYHYTYQPACEKLLQALKQIGIQTT